MEMLECGMRHMPVVTARGEVVGVLEDADLLAASARQSFMPAPLHRIGRRRNRIAGGRTARHRQSPPTCSATAPRHRRPARSSPSSSTAWCAGHSNWRSPRPDGDGRRVRVADARQRRPPRGRCRRRMWTARCRGATTCPRRVSNCARLPHAHTRFSTAAGCRTTATARSRLAPLFSRSQSEWFAAAEGWLDDPLRDSGLMMSSLLIDGRVVWGDPRCTPFPPPIRSMRDEHSECAAAATARRAVGSRCKTRSLRDVLSRRGGTFDLKHHAMTPIVNLARWGGLTAGVTSASTPARLERGGAGGCDQRPRRRNALRRLRRCCSDCGWPIRSTRSRPAIRPAT